MKLKLSHIVIEHSQGEDTIHRSQKVLEYDELANGIVIKQQDGVVYKYIGQPYVIVRVPA